MPRFPLELPPLKVVVEEESVFIPTPVEEEAFVPPPPAAAVIDVEPVLPPDPDEEL